MKHLTKWLAACLVILLICSGTTGVVSEEPESPTNLYVTADVLNGRLLPTKKASVEARFDFGDILTPTGKHSKDLKWIEVEGGENGTCWVDIRYVSERFMEYELINENNGRVKIRSKPFGGGRVVGYLRNGGKITVDQVVLGWGHCKRGWIDTGYLIEEVETN